MSDNTRPEHEEEETDNSNVVNLMERKYRKQISGDSNKAAPQTLTN